MSTCVLSTGTRLVIQECTITMSIVLLDGVFPKEKVSRRASPSFQKGSSFLVRKKVEKPVFSQCIVSDLVSDRFC